MILKFLIVIVLFALIVRAALNLWAAIQADDPAAHNPPFHRDRAGPRRVVDGRSYETVLTSEPRVENGRKWKRAVEDARFRDV